MLPRRLKDLQGVEPAEMRTLAQQICGTPGTIALLAVLEPNPQFCLARSEDIPLNMNSVLKASAGRYGGRGGGQPHLVQGVVWIVKVLAACFKTPRSSYWTESTT